MFMHDHLLHPTSPSMFPCFFLLVCFDFFPAFGASLEQHKNTSHTFPQSPKKYLTVAALPPCATVSPTDGGPLALRASRDPPTSPRWEPGRGPGAIQFLKNPWKRPRWGSIGLVPSSACPSHRRAHPPSLPQPFGSVTLRRHSQSS